MTTMKWRVRHLHTDQCEVTVFVGQTGQTLQNSGKILLSTKEIEDISFALQAGDNEVGCCLFEVETVKPEYGNPAT